MPIASCRRNTRAPGSTLSLCNRNFLYNPLSVCQNYFPAFSPGVVGPDVPPSLRTSSSSSKSVPYRMSTYPRSTQEPHNLIPSLREALRLVDAKVAVLNNERKEIESMLEAAVRSQSPVLRLPSEILSTIFTIGVLKTGDDDPVMVATLMLVCRYWTQVTLSTPLLWSKIIVSPHEPLQKAKRKLLRSKACPLDISVNFEQPRCDYVSSSIMEQVVHAMDLIRPALWRTKSFCLSVPNRAQAHAALLRCQENAPILESLSIQVYNAMQDDHYSKPPLPLFNGYTPRLRSCSFTSFNFGWDLRLLSRLRVLKLGGYFNSYSPSISTILDILRQCPDLEELVLRSLSDDVDPCLRPPYKQLDHSPVQGKLVYLPKLTKISFFCACLTLAHQIMGNISFPNLRSMEMCSLENVTPILHLLYTQALTRLSLQHLRIESCLLSELKFLNLLRRIPSLVSLELVDVEDASSGLLKALSSSQQPWVCPRLERLVLDGCTNVEWDSLRTFVESRRPTRSYPQHHIQDPQTFLATQVYTNSASTASLRRLPSSAPQRIRFLDVTRCNQISKEMILWLRINVEDVKC